MPRRIRPPEVLISSSQRAVRVPRKRIAELIEFLAEREGARIAQVDVAVVGRGEMVSLNRRYLSRTGPTDVLAFDLSESPAEGIVAQIIVCGPVAVRQAGRRGLGPQGELLLYVTHGLLHLIGYDHSSAAGAARMQARQEQLLAEFRIAAGKAKLLAEKFEK